LEAGTWQPEAILIPAETEKMIFLKRLFDFYYQGFRGMTTGKKLWIIILIKLFIIFVVLRLFFFPDFLRSNFRTDEERSNHVIDHLTHTK
jgi:uncharacterized membrane protein